MTLLAYGALFLISAALIFGGVRRALLFRTALPNWAAIAAAAMIGICGGVGLVWIAAAASDTPPCITFTADPSGRC